MVAKFGLLFGVVLVIGGCTVGSVGAIVCECVWVVIVEFDHSVGAISNTDAIVVGRRDYCYEYYYNCHCCYDIVMVVVFFIGEVIEYYHKVVSWKFNSCHWS